MTHSNEFSRRRAGILSQITYYEERKGNLPARQEAQRKIEELKAELELLELHYSRRLMGLGKY